MPDLSSPRARFGLRFSMLARRWRQALDAHLAASGMTDATWVPLVHLEDSGGGIAQKDLAQRVGVDGSSLVRVLDILERQGLIERRRDANDGRTRLLFLTPAGEARVSEIRTELIRAEQAMLAGLDDAALERMLEGIAQIETNLAARIATGDKETAV